MSFNRFSIVIIALLAALSLAAFALIERDRGPEHSAPPLLLISIDGFRYDYLERSELPALKKLAAEGLKADSLQHIFPTKTFATHYATATGLYAENSGVVANSMWDPKRKSSFSMRNRDAVGDGYWYDGEPIWNTVEKAGKIAATYFWPGSEAQIGGIRPRFWKPYAGDTSHDDRVDQVLAWLDLPPDQRPDFLTLYFSAVDSAGHAHGPGDAKVVQAMDEVDRALGRLLDGLERRGLYGNMHVLVTSDHGMQQIDLDRYVLLDQYLDLSRVRVSDWGPAAQIWAIEGGPSREEIFQALNRPIDGVRRVWKKGEGPPRYHFDDHQRIPDVTIEAQPGWMISNKPYYAGMQRGVLNGMHGWDPAWLNMHGIFIANGPAFMPGAQLPAVRSVDLYSLMARLMDIAPADTDGSLMAFEPLLARAGASEVATKQFACDGENVLVRQSPGLAALHLGAFVFALPAMDSAGAHYADSGVELEMTEGRARVEAEGRILEDCRLIGDDAG
ncbi:MAG: ectonucleotide pyrophosphatase/phosphodiesterase [Wenzhouxiangellaceae bacterium]|nr:ectonucleotide pyrophosphatase/phosphodiesterase [Wenzhouxiangellaceae bacterium]